MSEYVVTDTELIAVANAIRTKGGTSADLEWNSGFISAIQAISGGGGGSGGGGATVLSGTTAPMSSQGSDGDLYLELSALIQPLVTQQSELYLTVTANTNWSGYEPWKAFTANSGWIGAGGNPHWLQIEASSTITLASLDFKSVDGNRSHAISRIGYSNDGTTFTDAVLTESTMSSNIGHAELSQAVTAKYFRLYFDGEYGLSTYPTVGSLELYSDEGTFIKASYLKVSGLWQNLIGSDIDDVNTSGETPSDNPFALTDYIESSGTQYIDTGYSIIENTKLELIANINSSNASYACPFGARDNSGDTYSTKPCEFFVKFNSQSYFVPQFASTVVAQLLSSDMYNAKVRILLNKENGNISNQDGKIGGQFINYQAGYLPSSTNKLFIFNLNQGGASLGATCACIMKLYRFRIYEDNTLVHEFIPWKDGNNVVCLKDTVTGNLKYNAGTGDFTYGTDA